MTICRPTFASGSLSTNLQFGATLGALAIRTGSGNRSGVPSTEEIFDPEDVPGLGQDTSFTRWGGFINFDYRDISGGPRSGGFYSFTIRQYEDMDLDEFHFGQLVLQVQQYIPYFNKNRVIAVRARVEVTSEDEGSTIPFYLQPKLGGNDDLRGFERYRFYDNQSLIVNVEHRWHASSVLDMAIFADVGKVAPHLRDVDFSDLEFSAGIGFRWKLQGAYFMRIDFAGSREGFRIMWTFSDIFKTRWGIYLMRPSAVIALVAVTLAATAASAQKFYPDDPLAAEPELWPTTDPQAENTERHSRAVLQHDGRSRRTPSRARRHPRRRGEHARRGHGRAVVREPASKATFQPRSASPRPG